MKEIVIELFLLNELPKRFEDIKPQIDSKIIVFHTEHWNKIYDKIINQIENSYHISNADFQLFHKDNVDRRLVELKDDLDVETACFLDKFTVEIVIYNKKIKDLKHFDVVCDSCKNGINDIRYVCLQCEDYKLCKNCKKAEKHNQHKLLPCPSIYGYSICDDCLKEIKTNKNVCLDCTKTRVPKLNETKVNKSIKWVNYLICDTCKINHMTHSMRSNSITDINKLHDKLVNDLKEKRKKGIEIKEYKNCGNCFVCRKNSVLFQCGTLDFLHILLCANCLENGAFKNLLTFKFLNDEEANILSENLNKPPIIQKKASNLKSKSTNNLRSNRPFSSLEIDM